MRGFTKLQLTVQPYFFDVKCYGFDSCSSFLCLITKDYRNYKKNEKQTHRTPEIGQFAGVDSTDVPYQNATDGIKRVFALTWSQHAVQHSLWHWNLQHHILNLTQSKAF